MATTEDSATRLLAEESHAAYRGWAVVGGAAVGVFVSFASLLVSTFGIFLKPLINEFSWSRATVSLAFSLSSITFAMLSPAMGYVIDRFEARRIIIPCLFVFGCGFASLSLLRPQVWHLYAVFMLLGLAGMGTAQMAYARIVAAWFSSRRGLALSLLMSGSAIGAILLPPAAQALVDNVGWRAAYVALGGMVLLVGLPVVGAFVHDRHVEAKRDVATKSSPLTQSLRSGVFLILTSVVFLSAIGYNGAIIHISALLTDRGVSSGSAALAISAIGAAGVAGRLITGWLIDRVFAPRVSFALLTVAAVGMFLLAFVKTAGGGLVAAVLLGFSMGGEGVITPYLIARYFGLSHLSTLYSITWMAYGIAAAIGPVVMGRAFDATSSYRRLVIGLSVVTLVSAGLMFLVPRYRGGE